MPKTWQEKLHNGRQPQIEVLEKPMMGLPAGAKLYISTPLVVQDTLKSIPIGKCLTIPQLRERLAKDNRADATCPLTTSIFVRIIAEAAHEEMLAGKKPNQVAPFWRVIDPKSPLAKKLTFGAEEVERLRKSEGIG